MQQQQEVKLHVDSLSIFKDIELKDSRFINAALIRENQSITFKEEEYIPVDLSFYASTCKITLKQAYKQVLEIATNLRDTSFTLKLVNGYDLTTSLVYSILSSEKDCVISINWNKKFIPFISGIMPAGKFVMLEPSMVTIKSQKRYSLYILLKTHLWELAHYGKFSITKDTIREVLRIEETEYTAYKELNKWLIKPTLKDMYKLTGVNLTTKVIGTRVEFSHVI